MSFQLSRLKRSLPWAPAALAVAMAALPALAENAPCLQCNLLRASTDANHPLSGPGVAGNSATLNLGINVAGFLNRPGPSVGYSDAPVISAGMINWAPGQELPGAFHRPWEFVQSDFNPAFETPYYSDTQGALNVAAAPWNWAFGDHVEARNDYFVQNIRMRGPLAPQATRRLM